MSCKVWKWRRKMARSSVSRMDYLARKKKRMPPWWWLLERLGIRGPARKWNERWERKHRTTIKRVVKRLSHATKAKPGDWRKEKRK